MKKDFKMSGKIIRSPFLNNLLTNCKVSVALSAHCRLLHSSKWTIYRTEERCDRYFLVSMSLLSWQYYSPASLWNTESKNQRAGYSPSDSCNKKPREHAYRTITKPFLISGHCNSLCFVHEYLMEEIIYSLAEPCHAVSSGVRAH